MLKRIVSQSRIGETQTRWRVVIEDDDSAEGSEMARVRQYYFLRELAENQSLLDCGYHKFATLKIHHNGSRWIAEAEVVTNNE